MHSSPIYASLGTTANGHARGDGRGRRGQFLGADDRLAPQGGIKIIEVEPKEGRNGWSDSWIS